MNPACKFFSVLLVSFFVAAHCLTLTTHLKGGLQYGRITGIATNYHGINLNYAWEGRGVGKTRLLHGDWLETHYGMPYKPREQGSAPSCVAQAAASCIDFMAVTEVTSGELERVPSRRMSAAVIYGLARQEIAGVGEYARGGAMVQWACLALRDYGAVASINYQISGIDLRLPSPARCIEYGMYGCPDELEGIAKLHSIRGFVRINNWKQLRDAVATGHPVIVGSNIGFGEGVRTRDKDGFLVRPKWWHKGYNWNHAMCIIGMTDEGRKGALILNSWGTDWCIGPKRFDSDPEGSFWVDAEVANDMMAQDDSYALVGFNGYPKRVIWR